MLKSSLIGILFLLTLDIPILPGAGESKIDSPENQITEEHKTLAIGAEAPDFSLPDVDGKIYSLKDFQYAKILVVVFMCNHCPTSQAYEQRMIQLTLDYKSKNVAIVAINPNHPGSVRLDELGYSDLGDSFDEMKIRSLDAGFNFSYLYDGETETVSKKFGPVCTPHIFIFDQARKLRYYGRIDDTENPQRTPHSQDTRNAIEALLNNQEIAVTVTKVFGCSIKWEKNQTGFKKQQSNGLLNQYIWIPSASMEYRSF